MKGICVSALLALAACGARTGLSIGDGGPDTGLHDAGPDVPPPCRSDSDCDDHVACTVDSCHPEACHHDLEDSRCDDHLYCDGIETCSSTGCVPGTAPCNDGVACTDDTCAESTRTCAYTPNPRNCPLSNRCDAVRGCEPRVLAHDTTTLYDIELPSGMLYPIVRTDTSLTDIALAEDGTFYGATTHGLVRLDERTGVTTLVLPVAGHFVALEADPTSGALYGATGARIVRFDLGVGATDVALLPGAVQASGDIAFAGGRLLITTTTTGDRTTPDDLYAVPLDASAIPVRIGSVGVGCVWGLATYHDTLYGLTCTGDVLTVDPATGAGTRIVSDGVEFGGAAAR